MTTADEDRIAARRAEAIKLRVRGKTIREIAEALKISVGQAHDDVRTAMGAIAKEAEENVQQERGLELHRLERALLVVEEVLLADEPTEPEGGKDTCETIESSRELKLKALDRLVKIQDQRAKLLGLYAAEKKDITGKIAAVGLDELDALRKGAEANESSGCPTDPETTGEPEPSS